MYEPPFRRSVRERSTLFEYGDRLRVVRTGRFADAASALAWVAGAGATALHPAGLAVAGFLLGLVASSVERAVASAASFGIVVIAAAVLWLTVSGSSPPAFGLDLVALIAAALFGPPTVAALVRVLG